MDGRMKAQLTVEMSKIFIFSAAKIMDVTGCWDVALLL
jgi:hypothetical protein